MYNHKNCNNEKYVYCFAWRVESETVIAASTIGTVRDYEEG